MEDAFVGDCFRCPKTFFHYCNSRYLSLSLWRLGTHPIIESQLLKITDLLASLNSLSLSSPLSLCRIGVGWQSDSWSSMLKMFRSFGFSVDTSFTGQFQNGRRCGRCVHADTHRPPHEILQLWLLSLMVNLLFMGWQSDCSLPGAYSKGQITLCKLTWICHLHLT